MNHPNTVRLVDDTWCARATYYGKDRYGADRWAPVASGEGPTPSAALDAMRDNWLRGPEGSDL